MSWIDLIHQHFDDIRMMWMIFCVTFGLSGLIRVTRK